VSRDCVKNVVKRIHMLSPPFFTGRECNVIVYTGWAKETGLFFDSL